MNWESVSFDHILDLGISLIYYHKMTPLGNQTKKNFPQKWPAILEHVTNETRKAAGISEYVKLERLQIEVLMYNTK